MSTPDLPIKPDSWQKSDTIRLIKLIGDFKSSNINDKINNNEMFMQVANKLFDFGVSRTYIQCKNKWNELIESYKIYKKSPEGEAPIYFNEIDKITHKDTNETESNNKYGPTWSQYETSFLVKVMKAGGFITKLKNEEPLQVYEQIAQYMQRVGPISRNKEDIQQRWKNLKQSYIKYIKGELLHFKYFEIMDDLLDWEPHSIAFEEDQFKDGHEYGDENYENPDDFNTRNAPSVKRALNWTHKETELLLDVVQKYNMKQMKRDDIATIFDDASIQLRLQGYKRSSEQCRVKFKHLKVKYFGSLRRVVGGEDHPERYFSHFDRMREIMQNAGPENFPDTDNENSDFAHDDEHYEVEYLEDVEDPEPEITQVYLKEQNHAKLLATSRHNRKGRAIWSQTETQYLLSLLKVRNVKRYCRRPMFEEIALEMCKAGYKRSAQMCMIKWKNLRNSLYSCIRNMVEGKEELCPFYEEICEIVQKNGNVDVSLISEQDHHEYDESDCQFETEDSIDHKFDQIEESPTCSTDKSEIDPEKKRHFQHQHHGDVKNEAKLTDKPPSKKFKTSETNTDNLSEDSAEDSSRFICNYKMDDVEHYCISLASTFKRIPKRKQAKLKIEIQKLLYAAEFDDDF